MTSRYPSFHGATTHLRRADPRFPTLFEALSAEGFAVVGVTGNPFVSETHGLARGFDSLVYSGLRADVISRLALRAAEQWGGGDLALFVHYMDPHSSYQPPPPFDTRFGERYAGIVDGYNYVSAAKTDADREHVRALYDGEIAYTDQEIAALLDELDKRGLRERAVIAYTADHGEELFERGAWGHAHTLHEELIHVPFALRVPGKTPARIQQPVSLIDLAPTLLEALAVRRPSSFQGRSLLPLLGGGTLEPTPLFSETARTEKSHQVAIRDGRFKYAARFGVAGGAHTLEREELFDLDADPGERQPLARDLTPFRNAVEAFLKRGIEAGAATTEAPLSAEEQEQLRALGYVN
jgi:arylsulfatase A-like enzyme